MSLSTIIINTFFLLCGAYCVYSLTPLFHSGDFLVLARSIPSYFLCFYAGFCALRLVFSNAHHGNLKKKLVVITGCDSGFGLQTSKKLASLGYSVVAACLTKEGVESLRMEGIPNLFLIQCDVTNQKSVECLVTFSSDILHKRGLTMWALINNAGIAPMGFTEWLDQSTFEKCMAVNYFGLVRVTKAFLELLKRTKHSRIINVSSMAGHFAGAGFSAYSASKHAVEGFAKGLRVELHPWNIHVCNINPAFMRTPMIDASICEAQNAFERAPDDIKTQYAKNPIENDAAVVRAVMEDPIKVVNMLVHACRVQNPPLNLFVGWQAALLRGLLILPPRWIEVGANLFGQTPRSLRAGVVAEIQGTG